MVKNQSDEELQTEFRKYFDAFVIGDIKKSLQAGVEVGTIILTTVGIECLSGYYAGKKSERKHFVEFMKEFMPAYKSYADDIYCCVRNGLAHDYVIKMNNLNNRSFIFKRDQGELHLLPTSINPDVIYLNREIYANDFLKAQEQYFGKVETNQDYWDKAMKRLKNQAGFLTVRSEKELIASSPSPVARGTSTNYLSTGTSYKPPGTLQWLTCLAGKTFH